MLAAPAAASAYAPYPVTFSVPHAALAAAKDPSASPPGANNWSCKPSAAHPRPVVLVHGLLANMADNWDTIAPLLADNGFCVFALTYGSDGRQPLAAGLASMRDSAREFGAFVDRVLAATGATKVDLVGHSEGTVMPRYWTNMLGGASKVDHYVMLTPIWHGTLFFGASLLQQFADAYLPLLADTVRGVFDVTRCISCTELLTGSAYLEEVDASGRALPGITYTNIYTEYDELVLPYTSGNLVAPNTTNYKLQDVCPLDAAEHLAVAFDPVAAQLMLNALDPSHAKAPPCTVVTPVGAPLPPQTVGLTKPAARSCTSRSTRATRRRQVKRCSRPT